MKKLLDLLYKEGEYVNFRIINGKNRKEVTNRFVQYNDKYAEEVEEKIIKKYKSENNIYFGVQPRASEKTGDIQRLNAFYLDFDSKDFPDTEYDKYISEDGDLIKLYTKLKIFPNFRVFSGNGNHDYFCIENINKNSWEKIQVALVELTRADKAVKDIPRIMRYPNTLNVKDMDTKKEVTYKYNHDIKYSQDNFAKTEKAYAQLCKSKADKIEKARKEEKTKAKIRSEYIEHEESYEKSDLHMALINTFSLSKNLPFDYESFIKICLSFKSEGFTYAEIDKAFSKANDEFRNVAYDYDKNQELYEKLDSKKLTMGTAYYYAKEYVPDILKKELSKCKKKAVEITDTIFTETNFCYYACVSNKKGEEIVKKISNFTCSVEKQIYNDNNEVQYNISIKSKQGHKTANIDGDKFCILADFKKWLGLQGPYVLKVKDVEFFAELTEHILDRSKKEKAKKTAYLGKINNETFLMNNCMITKAGTFPISDLIPPETGKMQNQQKEKIDFVEFIKDMNVTYKDQAWKMIGFAVASFFSKEIAKKISFFPLLFICGGSQTGKGTLAQIIRAMFGVHNISPFNFDSTSKAFQRTIAQHYNCPITINEYDAGKKQNGLLNKIFDREGYLRANKDNTLAINEVEINGTCIFMGTELISGFKGEDVASRCVTIDANKIEKVFDIKNKYKNKIEDLVSFISFCFENMEAGELLDKIEKSMRQNRLEAKSKYKDRIIENHTIIQQSYNMFLEKLDLIDQYGITYVYMEEDMKLQNDETKETGVAETIKNIMQMIVNQDKGDKYSKIVFEHMKNKKIYFKKEALIIAQQEAARAKIELPDIRTILLRLKEAGIQSKSVTLYGKSVRLYCFENEEPDENANNHTHIKDEETKQLEKLGENTWYNEYDKRMMEV